MLLAFITRQVRSAIPEKLSSSSKQYGLISVSEHKMEATPVWSGEGGCGVASAWVP